MPESEPRDASDSSAPPPTRSARAARTLGGLALLLGVLLLAFWFLRAPSGDFPRGATVQVGSDSAVDTHAPFPKAAASQTGARDARLDANESKDDVDRLRDSTLADAKDEFFTERFGEPTPQLIRDALASAIDREFGDLELSESEVTAAADALARLRETRLALRALPVEATTAEERRALLEQMTDATAQFTEILGIDPAGFTERVEEADGGGGGIDRDLDSDYVPDADYLRSRR